MTTFTISSNTNIDACAGGTGGHVYNISNAAVLTIDQDSRAGLNGTTANSIERIVTASTGGTTLIEARYVRLIPFTDGSGTIEAGATVDCGDATGKVIAIYTSKTAAPALTGASGWIKVKAWNSVAYPTSGTFTKGGFTFTISGADIVGWIEVLAEEGTTAAPGCEYTGAYLPGVGHDYGFEALGEWFELGTTSGESNQTFQIPTNGQLCYIPGIFIEKTSGVGDFEFYANVADATDIATDIRAKVCWVPNTGLARLGNNGSTAAGYTPSANLRVVVGNIITSHCTAAARTANVIPNATTTTRFAIGSTSYGTSISVKYRINKASVGWRLYWYNAQPGSEMSYSGVFDSMSIISGNNLSLDHVGVGLSANLNQIAFDLAGFSSSTVSDCAFWSSAASGVAVIRLIGCRDLVFNRVKASSARNFTVSYNSSFSIGGSLRISLNYCHCVSSGALAIATGAADVTAVGTQYVDKISGTTGTTGNVAVSIGAGSSGVKIDGLSFLGLTNVHPLGGIVSCATGVTDCIVCNIGSYASPLDFGSANSAQYFVTCPGGSATSQVRIFACYASNVRNSLANSFNDSYKQNTWSSGVQYALASRPLSSDSDWRGVCCAGTLGTVDNIPGTHFWDSHTSTTAGRYILLMHPASALSAPYVTFAPSATAFFNGSNGLFLKSVNDTCTWEDRVYRIGHTGFSGAPVMAGGTSSNYLIEYAIDLNDGVGWRDFEAASAVNLEARNASIDSARGFKIKVRITTTNANTSAITSLYFGTTSTTTTQAYQYKMYETPVTIHCVDAVTLLPVAGAVVWVEAGTGGEYSRFTEVGGGTSDANGDCVVVLKHDAAQQIEGTARKTSASPVYSQGVLQATIAPGVSQIIVVAMTREDQI
jgi:hypothetical protein